MRKAIFCLVAVFAGFTVSAQQAPDSTTNSDRKFFDFLIGNWKIVSFEREGKRAEGGDDVYRFERAFPGALSSQWHFNRGTKEKPDFTDAYCYIAYNNLTRNWSFYYISPLSAQYFDGQKLNGNWMFSRLFDLGKDNKFLQRQYWVLKDEKTLERHTENSYDEGKSWKVLSVYTLAKQGG